MTGPTTEATADRDRAVLEPAPWSPAEFEARLRAKSRSHPFHHPFNVRMNAGGCTPDEIRCWVANQFCHLASVPRRDAAILANMPDREHRRIWVERLLDHDGRGPYDGPQAGRIEAWTRLGEAVGIAREELWSLRYVVPAVRLSCDADVSFAMKAPWQEAVCASLSEALAPMLPRNRLECWVFHYPWIEPAALSCIQAGGPGSVHQLEHAVRVTLEHFRTRAAQQRALEIIQFRLDILWTLTDAVERASQ